MRVQTARRREYDRLRLPRNDWFARWRPRGRGLPLSDYQVRAVRNLVIEQGETRADVARRLRISYSHCCDIVAGRKRGGAGRGTAGHGMARQGMEAFR